MHQHTHTHAQVQAHSQTHPYPHSFIATRTRTHSHASETMTRERVGVCQRERKKDEMPSGAKSCEAVCNFACDNCLYPQSLYIKIVTETCISLTLSRSYTLSLSILHTQARTHTLSRSFTPASLDIFLNYPAVSFAW